MVIASEKKLGSILVDDTSVKKVCWCASLGRHVISHSACTQVTAITKEIGLVYSGIGPDSRYTCTLTPYPLGYQPHLFLSFLPGCWLHAHRRLHSSTILSTVSPFQPSEWCRSWPASCRSTHSAGTKMHAFHSTIVLNHTCFCVSACMYAQRRASVWCVCACCRVHWGQASPVPSRSLGMKKHYNTN